jgi:4-amino-4-deoxy-L-arabinose transferase-like glycosyltransferase
MSPRLRLKYFLKPRMDAPFPAWMIFPVIFVALYASHFTLLALPYYWDEAGYYIPAAWDFFRTGSLIPVTTLSTSHPPLESIYLALWWKASGFHPEVTREAVLMVTSLGLLGVWRLATRLAGSATVAFWTVVLTALYPVWFAQSTLAHADMFAAACTLWGLVYALPDQERKPWAAALWFTAAALCKETAIAIPLTLSLMNIVAGFRARPPARFRLWIESAWLAACVVPLAGWYVWHFTKTGFYFGDAGYLRYNAQDTVAPMRVLAAFGYRVLHLTAHMNMFVPVLMTFAALMLNPRLDAEGHERQALSRCVLRRILALLLVNAALFSVLGGALLTRYLLPMYPLVLLVAVSTFYRRVPFWQGLALFSAAAFIAGLFINPPYRFAPEDNLEYARVVRMHVAGIAQLNKLYRGATVLTAWPVTDELTRPELGYVKTPYEVYRLDDFTEAQIDRAAAEPEMYSAALVFSTKYDPPELPLSLGPKSEAMDEQYFGLHHDMLPAAIAAKLGGNLVWERENANMWIALLRFNRQIEAFAKVPKRPSTNRGR